MCSFTRIHAVRNQNSQTTTHRTAQRGSGGGGPGAPGQGVGLAQQLPLPGLDAVAEADDLHEVAQQPEAVQDVLLRGVEVCLGRVAALLQPVDEGGAGAGHTRCVLGTLDGPSARRKPCQEKANDKQRQNMRHSVLANLATPEQQKQCVFV